MREAEKVTYTDADGAPHVVLVVDDAEPELGIPLLDLVELGLPEDIEARLRIELWAQGIHECTDALLPGANEKIAAALRGALRLAVGNLVSLCAKQYERLTGD